MVRLPTSSTARVSCRWPSDELKALLYSRALRRLQFVPLVRYDVVEVAVICGGGSGGSALGLGGISTC